MNGTPANLTYEMKYNNTIAVKGPQDPAVNSFFDFQTRLLTLRLETQANAPLNGGTARWGNGSSFGTYYFPAPNLTGSSAAGETAAQFFPGTYSFEMNYQSTAQVKPSVVIPDADTKLTWQTTPVTLQFSGEIAYGGSGDSRYFNKPAMELLPSTVNFNFRPCAYTAITIGTSPITLSYVCGKLLNSSGTGLAGGLFEYRIGWGAWTPMGTTVVPGGKVLYAVNGLQTNLGFRVNYAGGQTTEKIQNVATDSFVVFQTMPVTALLKDSANNAARWRVPIPVWMGAVECLH